QRAGQIGNDRKPSPETLGLIPGNDRNGAKTGSSRSPTELPLSAGSGPPRDRVDASASGAQWKSGYEVTSFRSGPIPDLPALAEERRGSMQSCRSPFARDRPPVTSRSRQLFFAGWLSS